ncbi:MAG: hypothetical protein C0596_09030 [Marinilabiliales bacterium]|nr:MAG: hypothetical protein C0596_09030 [Marinilabiliales bacterium]
MVEINDVAEQNAVYDAIISGAGVSTTYTSISNGGGIAYVWIGATDSNNEGTWIWDGNNDADGNTFWIGEGSNGAGDGSAEGGAYINWGGTSGGTPNEPDDYSSGQDHGAIGLAGWPSGTTMLGSPGEWNDIIGTSLLYFVIEIDETSSINGNTQSDNIKIYPNPTSGEFFVEGNANKVEIYNSIGQLIAAYETSTTNTCIKHGLCSGLNIVKVITERNTHVQNLIVN